MRHNCNTFSEELCQFLCGTSIPKFILDLPYDLLSTPIGQTLAPLIESLNTPANGTFSFEPQITPREGSPGFDQLNLEIEQARQQSLPLEERRQKLSNKRENKDKSKKKKKSSKKSASDSDPNNMSEHSENGTTNDEIPRDMLPSEKVLEEEAAERAADEERKRNRDPPIVFKNVNVSSTYLSDISPNFILSFRCIF